MRKQSIKDGLSVRAISGPHVVVLGFDVTAARKKGLLGFAIHRTNHTKDETVWLQGFKTFQATAPNPPPGSLVSTQQHPIQGFSWGDYTVEPNQDYTYEVTAMYGTPRKLTEGPSVSVDISSPDNDQGTHAIFFNRGSTASQAYARQFGNKDPDKMPPAQKAAALAWLSRGLLEAIVAYLQQAEDKTYALRAAVYEFSYVPVLKEFGAAKKRGVDVQIVYDRRPKGPWKATEAAAKQAGITKLLTHPRTKNPGFIAHNKFIVLLENGKPIQVWTGSTNFTEGGIFGQSNVGHIIRDPKVAATYLDYWTRLSKDPEAAPLREANTTATPSPKDQVPAGSITPIFSPRTDLGALEWYARRLGAAQDSGHLTLAFGISSTLGPPLLKKSAVSRYLILETPGTQASQKALFAKVQKVSSNHIAVGTVLEKSTGDHLGDKLHRWLAERLPDVGNVHVKYLHTKYMLLDPLSDDPTVISGSANFSSASTLNNDENMVVVRGNTDVADVFIGEFMRLFHHFYFRDVADRMATAHSESDDVVPYLEPDDSWTAPYFDAKTAQFAERVLFAARK